MSADSSETGSSPLRLSSKKGVDHLAVLFPAWEPMAVLAPLVAEVLEQGYGAVILVDDGSSESCRKLFEEISYLPRVHLLRHALNLGKGRALKTGINYFLNELPLLEGLVTADADGQHKAPDILRVAQALRGAGGGAVLGWRTFAAEVPLRSRFGNGLTRYIFAFVTGAKLRDTQTGLRAFSRALLPQLMRLEGERYEYEMTVLAHICRAGKPLEVPIETVYLDGNRSSHFDPIFDSMRIYFVLARFYFSAIVAAGIDFVGFSIAFATTGSVAASVLIGRLSSLVNFTLNRKYVFHSHASMKRTLWRYYALVAALGGISALLIWTLHFYLGWNIFAAKFIVETALSLISFSVQRTFIFGKPEEL